MEEKSIEQIVNAINNLNKIGLFEILSLLITTGASIVSIYFINKNTNKEINNQNKETYRPRLKLKSVKCVQSNSNIRHLYASSLKCEQENCIVLNFSIKLENIGYGIATDIKFYTLNNGDLCGGFQNDDVNVNQTLNSTFEIPKDKFKTINFKMSFNAKEVDEKEFKTDVVLLLCKYYDLNNNKYEILIGIILKKIDYFVKFAEKRTKDSCFIDYYYYQQGTKEFKNMINKYRKNYNLINKK